MIEKEISNKFKVLSVLAILLVVIIHSNNVIPIENDNYTFATFNFHFKQYLLAYISGSQQQIFPFVAQNLPVCYSFYQKNRPCTAVQRQIKIDSLHKMHYTNSKNPPLFYQFYHIAP